MTHPLDRYWDTYADRFLAEGVPWAEIRQMRERIADWEGWCAGWLDTARKAESRGVTALDKGFARTAGIEFWRASVAACFGHYLFWHAPDEKRAAHEYSAAMLRKAAPMLDPPLEPVEIPFDGIRMRGYVRRPRQSSGPAPCVVCIGGLDSGKEEWLVMSTLCAERGVATLVFDGPGQGETRYTRVMSPAFGDAVRAAIDFASGCEGIDPARIGLMGRSLGGYYAPRAAAMDTRVRALVVWGAMFDLANAASLPPHTREGFVYVTGSASFEAALPYMQSIDLADVVGEIRCPTYIVHGGRDVITPIGNATRMRDGVKGPVELALFPTSGHCNHDVAHVCRPAMADFLARTLAT
jgi:2,6-dihydroxypseudooxynicotine hydrolase